MRRRLLLPLLLLACAPAGAAAQAGSCVLVENRFVNRQDMGGFALISVAGPLRVECAGGTTLRADSASVYESTNEVHLFGRVDYRDPTRTLTSANATYSSVTGRLYATGNVVFTDITRGSTLRGPELEYYRAMEGRPQAQVIATQRPHLTVVPTERGSGGRANTNREPLEVDGDRITGVGENYFSASGNVVIHRSDLDATAAEALHDGAAQTLQLRGDAKVRGERFDLSGETVDAAMPGNRLERVVAKRNAELVSEKLRVDGPEVQLYFQNDLLQRLVSRRDPAAPTAADRPLVTATGLRMEADSLEAILPGQKLERVVAIGRAHGETIDTTGQGGRPSDPRARIARGERPSAATGLVRDRDWVIGDTITGFFAPRDSAAARPRTAARDTARSPEEDVELQRVVAKGAARSLYRVQEKDKPPTATPGLNYLVAAVIDLKMKDGELDLAEAQGLQRGVYLDPDAQRPATAQPAGTPGQAPAQTTTPQGTRRP